MNLTFYPHLVKQWHPTKNGELTPKQLISQFMLRHISLGILLIFICCLLAPTQSYSEDLDLQSLSMRARVSEHTVLGKVAPEEFEEYDVAVNFALPWQSYSRQAGVEVRV